MKHKFVAVILTLALALTLVTSVYADAADDKREKEPNDLPTEAQELKLPEDGVIGSLAFTPERKALLGFEDYFDMDYYKFTLTERAKACLLLVPIENEKEKCLLLGIDDGKTKVSAAAVWYDNILGSGKGGYEYYYEKDLDAGTYEVVVMASENAQDVKYNGQQYVLTFFTADADEETAKSNTDLTFNTEATGYSNFKKVNDYPDGLFKDVAADSWYAKTVQTAYELGLASGRGDTYAPDDNVTIAETLAFACRVHSIYHNGKADFTQGSPWYQVYVDYAVANGIVKDGEYTDFDAKATRAQFAGILYNALPADAYTKVNNIDKIPDVADNDSYKDVVFALYNAGVLTGSDEAKSFMPNSNIKRSEVATIVARMAVPSLRQVF